MCTRKSTTGIFQDLIWFYCSPHILARTTILHASHTLSLPEIPKSYIQLLFGVHLKQPHRTYCEAFAITFATYETTMPWKLHTRICRPKRTGKHVDYDLTRFRKHANEVLHRTDALLFRMNHLTSFRQYAESH